MSEKSFFLIWCPTRISPPSKKHHTLTAADGEAVRLALANPTLDFYVLEAIRKIEVSTIKRIDFERNDGVPF